MVLVSTILSRLSEMWPFKKKDVEDLVRHIEDDMPEFYSAPYGWRTLMSTGIKVPRYIPVNEVSDEATKHFNRCVEIADKMWQNPDTTFEQLRQHLKWSGKVHETFAQAYNTTEALFTNRSHDDASSKNAYYEMFTLYFLP